MLEQLRWETHGQGVLYRPSTRFVSAILSWVSFLPWLLQSLASLDSSLREKLPLGISLCLTMTGDIFRCCFLLPRFSDKKESMQCFWAGVLTLTCIDSVVTTLRLFLRGDGVNSFSRSAVLTFGCRTSFFYSLIQGSFVVRRHSGKVRKWCRQRSPSSISSTGDCHHFHISLINHPDGHLG